MAESEKAEITKSEFFSNKGEPQSNLPTKVFL